jgi:NADP-dependent 3-hydroxy acid dehydrogenase YdfG
MSKVWFITGCSKGFGLAITEELLKSSDARIVATARNPSTLGELQKQYPDRLLALKLDVTKQSDIEQAVQEAVNKFKRIDVLVNNAGYGLLGALEECSMPDIRQLYDTNVFGLMAMTKAVLPVMRAQMSGHIFNFSSISGLMSNSGWGLYSSTKFAVEGLSESLHGEVANFGIKVTIIEPGPFRTDFANSSSIHLAPALAAYENSPVNKMREYIKDIEGTQKGDPVKAAKIVVQIAEMQDPPLRMLLGNTAYDRILVKLEAFIADVKKNEKTSRSADFDK